MMRKRLLNQQNLTRRLGWLFLLFALLQMPIGVWAESVPETKTTTYTFTGMSNAESGSDYQYDVTSTVGSESRMWKVKNLTARDETSVNNRETTGYVSSTNSFSISNIDATSTSGTVVEFALESDFMLTGSFVSAKITYSTTNMSSSEAVVHKVNMNNGNYANLTYYNKALTEPSTTLSLDDPYVQNRIFDGNKIALEFRFVTDKYDGSIGAFTIESIEITTNIYTYPLWIGDVQVTVPDDRETISITSANNENIKAGSIIFCPGTENSNVLQLHGVQTEASIKSGLGGSLTVQLFGHNRIGSNENNTPAIYSESDGTLTFAMGYDSNHASLYVETGAINSSVINGFVDFVYTGFNLEASGGLYDIGLGLNDGNYGVQTATFYTGNLYSLWVGGTQVSSANMSDIKDDNILEGTVSYDPNTHTLTMNNVTADMASDGSFIESTIDELKVNLLGTNEVTLKYQETQNDNCFARLKTGTGSLTFETQRAQDLEDQYVFGSLTVKLSSGPSTVIDGPSDYTLVAQRYTISNTFGGETPCWRISDDLTDQVKVWYDGETYGLTVARISVTSANASNVLGDAITGTVSYDATSNTLTLDNVDLSNYGSNIYDRLIRYSGTDDLTIALKGDNNLSKIEYSSAGSGTPTLSFVKADDADDCTLELNYSSSTSNEGVIFLFKDVDFGNLSTLSDGPIAMVQAYNDPNQKALKYSLREYNTSVEHLVITSATTYPLWIGADQVTEENSEAFQLDDNEENVTISFAQVDDVNTLTLDGATLTSKTVVSGLPNLTVHLSGMNEINGGGYGYALKNGILSIDPSAVLTFTSDVENSSPTGSLYFRNYVTKPLDGFASYTYNNGLAYGRSDGEECVGLINYFLIGDNEINSASLSIGENITFNKETNTLSLNGVGDAGVIRYNQYEDITIEFASANSTGYIAGTGNGNLHIKKAANAEAPTLEISGNPDDMSPVSGFINCTWEDGLYMNPYTYQEANDNYTPLSGAYFDTEAGHFAHPSSSIDRITFSMEQAEATPSIWIGNVEVDQNGTFGTIEGASIAVVDDEYILTLSGASLEGAIVSSLPNLTIKLFGINYASQIVSADPSAELTIVMDDEAADASLSLTTEMASVISGFADVELTDVYYVCSEMYEYNTTSKKFVNPIDNTDIYMLTITSTEAYPLWIAGTQVTGANASNIFNDAYSSASYAGNTLTLKACQNSSTDYDYAIMIGGEENLNIDFVGFNHLGSTHTKTFIYAKDACTVTFSTDETMPGQMECFIEDGGDFNTDNVTIVTGDLNMVEEGSTTTLQSSSANNIYYFGIQSFNANYWDGDYPSGDYVWYFSNAVTNSDNSSLPPIVSSAEGTSKMKHDTEYETIKSLTFQCMPLSGDAEITVALKNLEDESIEYATGTLTNGVVTLTPNATVTYEDVCLVFTSTSSFSFIPLAVQTEIKPDAPYFTPYEEENPASFAFEFGGDEVRYTIDYASDDLEDVEEASWTYADGEIAITGPCTVTAYTVKDGVESDLVKGKYFGPASTKQSIVLGADPVALAIAPAIEEGDGIMIYGIESSYISFDEETQKATATTMGSGSFPVPLKYTGQEYEEGNTFILNYSNFEMQVEVVPPVPTISLEDGTYLSTHDPITITGTGLNNTTIKYKWNDGTAQTYAEAIPVQTGTLTAWVEYSDGTTTVSSDEVTAEYTVKIDIANLYVAPVEDVPYTGSAVTPTIVVKASEEAEAALVAGTDFTVSYKQGEIAVAYLVNMGSYTAVITGKGNYGGTKEVTFAIKRQLDIAFSDNSWTTYYATESLTVPTGLEAYTVTEIKASEVTVAKIAKDFIPANTAVLLKVADGANPASSYMAEAYDGTDEIGTNLLQGTSSEKAVSTITNAPVFVLYKDQFVKTTTGSIPAHRGYLVVDPATITEPSSRALTIVIGNVTTRVAGTAIATSDDDRYYDLQGRRVNKADVKKGLYIRNGKKVFIRNNK